MVCTANDLQEWKDFPKGLRVLLLDEDSNSSSEIRSKLEAMDYDVSVFSDETEALSAFSSKPECFHLAIVEVNTNDGDRTFRFLETAKELPIIMTSNVHCLSTMMKCIALGAVEFLRKPLSEEKLRNIWQHVVHKAFNAGGEAISKLLIPIQESKENVLHVKLEKEEPDEKVSSMEIEDLSDTQENEHEQSAGSDKYPAPSTPQLKQGARLLDDGDCQDQTNCSAEKESGEQDGESKSVETTCDSVAEVTHLIDLPEMAGTSSVKEEEDFSGGPKNDGNTSSHQQSDDTSSHRHDDDTSSHQHSGNISSHQQSGDCMKNVNVSAENASKASGPTNSCLSKSSRKKIKIDWTTELHKKFVHAVEQLGVDQAIPSRILELMKVEGLTRHNVASHLQKYRMHKRHILPKEEERIWPRPRDPVPRNCYAQRPVMAFPTFHSNHTVPVAPVYPLWGQPGRHPASVQMWPHSAYPPWQPPASWHWQPYPGVHADAWGCPVVPPPHPSYASFHQQQNAQGFQNTGAVDTYNIPRNAFDHHPAEEVIDKVVKEAINKPWLPLPLGLKPPSTDSVLSELSRQGISTIPPSSSS